MRGKRSFRGTQLFTIGSFSAASDMAAAAAETAAEMAGEDTAAAAVGDAMRPRSLPATNSWGQPAWGSSSVRVPNEWVRQQRPPVRAPPPMSPPPAQMRRAVPLAHPPFVPPDEVRYERVSRPFVMQRKVIRDAPPAYATQRMPVREHMTGVRQSSAGMSGAPLPEHAYRGMPPSETTGSFAFERGHHTRGYSEASYGFNGERSATPPASFNPRLHEYERMGRGDVFFADDWTKQPLAAAARAPQQSEWRRPPPMQRGIHELSPRDIQQLVIEAQRLEEARLHGHF